MPSDESPPDTTPEAYSVTVLSDDPTGCDATSDMKRCVRVAALKSCVLSRAFSRDRRLIVRVFELQKEIIYHVGIIFEKIAVFWKLQRE